MTSIRDIKTAQPIIIDPNFTLPPGVVGMRYRRPEEYGDQEVIRDDESGELVTVTVGSADVNTTTTPGAATSAPAPTDILAPPNYITIISQESRVAADGRVVVDVIIDVPAPSGVTQIDVRLTKI